MDTSTQEGAIKGLIVLWEDIYFIQGKEHIASRLKPGIKNALKEVGPLFFSLAEGFAEYNNYPLELRSTDSIEIKGVIPLELGLPTTAQTSA